MTFPFNQLVFGSLATLVAFYSQQYEGSDRAQFLEEVKINLGLPQVKEYDFIIVGGGAAGGVVANRLSSKYHVLLLEAGGTPLPMSYVPGNWPYLYTHEKLAYEWKTVEQRFSCFGQPDNKMTIAQGKGLGGGGIINAMVYNRGHPEDYNNWANIVKDESWSYQNLLKYFQMIENFQGEQNDENGYGGPMIVTPMEDVLNEEELRVADLWKKAGQELGYEAHDNPNAPQKEGFVSLHSSKNFGRRLSSWDTFIKPVENRTTLTILRYSIGQKIHFDKQGKAVGVLYQRHGVNQYAKARKEIILSAGTFNSPHILLNSGVGPKFELRKAKIPIVRDLPVGRYFQDHPMVVIRHLLKKHKDMYPNPGPKDIDEFIKNGKGPLANIMSMLSHAYITSQEAKNSGKNWADLQLIMGYDSSAIYEGLDKLFMGCNRGRPSSYGNVSLNYEDPSKPLLINPNYLANRADVNALIECMQIMEKLSETKAFAEIGIDLDKTPDPACQNQKYASEEYWDCYIRTRTETIWHPVATCKMGPQNDQTSVVDSMLKVRGLKGLRVIDNSIQPTLTNANTHAPAFLIGMKGSDMILNEWKGVPSKDQRQKRDMNSRTEL